MMTGDVGVMGSASPWNAFRDPGRSRSGRWPPGVFTGLGECNLAGEARVVRSASGWEAGSDPGRSKVGRRSTWGFAKAGGCKPRGEAPVERSASRWSASDSCGRGRSGRRSPGISRGLDGCKLAGSARILTSASDGKFSTVLDEDGPCDGLLGSSPKVADASRQARRSGREVRIQMERLQPSWIKARRATTSEVSGGAGGCKPTFEAFARSEPRMRCFLGDPSEGALSRTPQGASRHGGEQARLRDISLMPTCMDQNP
jgi:hypothetical protein